MDNQQVSHSEETFKQHQQYDKLLIGSRGTIRHVSTGNTVYVRASKAGYLEVGISLQGKRLTLKVHRLVAECHLDPPCEMLVEKCSKEHHGKVIVKHLDNNKLNNYFLNLAWSSTADNIKDAWKDGLIPALKGERNGRAKLTDEMVHKLCKDYEDGMSPTEAIEKYGISRQQATKIRAGFQWISISSQYDIKVNKRVKTSTVSRET